MSLLQFNDRIFLAGARGMAGGAIVRALEQAGYGQSAQDGVLLTPSRGELDLLDSRAVNNWFEANKPTVVVLAAATVGGIQANTTRPADFLLQNLQIETNIIETAWRHGVRRLLFLGSSCIYPKFSEQPIREESLLNGSLEPTNEWYAIAKIAGIKLGEALRLQHGFDAISLMPTNLYGPGDNYDPTGSHVLPAMIRRFQEATDQNLKSVTCWGSGTPLREFLHADDLGSACLFALKNWDPSHPSSPKDDQGKPLAFLNVGTGFDLSIKELAEQVARIVGYKGSIEWDASKPDGTPKKLLNVSRLTNLGWTPTIPLQRGLPLAIEDFRQRRSMGLLRS